MVLVSRPGTLDFRFGDANERIATLDQVVRTDHYRFRKQFGCLSQGRGRIVKMLPARAILSALVVHEFLLYQLEMHI